MMAGKATLVKNIDNWRQKGFEGDWFIEQVYAEGDGPISTRAERLKYLTWGSPTARYLLHEMCENYIKKGDRELVLEQEPLTARFWEIILRYLHIDARVMHSGIAVKDRSKLQATFNNPNSSMSALVILYDVTSEGRNMQQSCHRVFVATCARNYSAEVQAGGRVDRVSYVLL